MATRPELEQQIAFGLQRLSSQNAHHDFEHLCRRLARKRICSNILPATGPVSAGGDQGRDFETFRMHLDSLPDATAFLALASSGPLVFGCTLQQDDVPSKVRADIASILGGAPVSEIHFFATAPVPTAKRHELQSWARENHQVHLEIYDREAISELLADPDVFWIATEYLKVPAELYPTSLEADDYAELKGTWEKAEAYRLNYAGFAQLKGVAREMLHNEALHPDVSFWLDRFNWFRVHEAEELRHMALYEIAVLSLRIKGDIHGLEPDVRTYVEYILTSIDTDRLADLACLVSYCTGAVFASETSLTAKEVLTFCERLRDRVKLLLDDTADPSRRCALLDLRGFVAHVPNPVTRALPDVEAVVGHWLQMLPLLPNAPLFDLRSFSDRLTTMVEFLVCAKGYDELAQGIDSLLAQRVGRFAAARARVERGQRLLSAGRILLGVRELNRAKHDWFTKETLGISAAALLDLSSHYSTLGLAYAAKYYALAAAWLVLQAGDDHAKRLVRPALIRAGECDYEAGAWLQALKMFSVAQRADAAFSLAPMADDDQDLHRLLLYGAYICGVSEGQPDQIRQAVQEEIADWPDREALEHGVKTARDAFYQIAATPGGDTQKHLAMTPFVDVAPTRSFEWSAIGITWTVSWPNTPEFTLMAEQFIAVLQLLSTDLAHWDLYILPGRIEVRFARADKIAERQLRRVPSNQASVWEMRVPATATSGTLDTRHLLDVVQSVMLIQEVSLRPEKWPVLEQLAAEGPYANTLVGEQYSRLYRRFCDIAAPVLESEHRDSRLETIHLRREPHQELAWKRSLADEYKEDEVRVWLRNRYDRFGAATRFTLPRLLANPGARALLFALRENGWLDWQILGAISCIAMNYRASLEFDPRRGSPQDFRSLCERYESSMDESEAWPVVPPEHFTKERLLFQLVLNAFITLKGAGFVCRQQTPNEKALLDFLRHKMRYFDDDLPHDDVLA